MAPSAPGAPATVAFVADGDVELGDGRRVRLLQVDAPELFGECYGVGRARCAAAPPSSRLAGPARARLALDDRGQYGRLLATSPLGATNVNVELVRRGAAAPYFFGSRSGVTPTRCSRPPGSAIAARLWGACPQARLEPGRALVTGRARSSFAGSPGRDQECEEAHRRPAARLEGGSRMPARDSFVDLVFEGGGVKGIGLAGALATLEERGYRPRRQQARR